LLAAETAGDASKVVHVGWAARAVQRAQPTVLLDTRLDALAEMLERRNCSRVVDLARFRGGNHSWHLDVVMRLQPRAVLEGQSSSVGNQP
jgi:hypothetical protein